MKKYSILSLRDIDKVLFIQKLEKELTYKFQSTIQNLPINYGYNDKQGLLYYINNDLLDSYFILYVDNKFKSASGGIIRQYNNEKVYQGQWRFFNTPDIYSGLCKHSYSIDILTNLQIKRARELFCSKFIISYNLHNKRLHDIHYKYQFAKTLNDDHGFFSSGIPQMFNNVPQYLLIKNL